MENNKDLQKYLDRWEKAGMEILQCDSGSDEIKAFLEIKLKQYTPPKKLRKSKKPMTYYQWTSLLNEDEWSQYFFSDNGKYWENKYQEYVKAFNREKKIEELFGKSKKKP